MKDQESPQLVKNAEQATEIALAFAKRVRPEALIVLASAHLAWVVVVRVGFDTVRFEVDRQSGKVMRFGTEATTPGS